MLHLCKLRFLTWDSIGPAASHDMYTVPFTKRSEQNGDEPHSGVRRLLQTISRLPFLIHPCQHSINNIAVPAHPRQLDKHVINVRLLQSCIPHCASCTAVYNRSMYSSVQQIHVQSQYTFIKHFPFYVITHHAEKISRKYCRYY